MNKYKKTTKQSMYPYEEGMSLTHVQVSDGVTPEVGGMIAVNENEPTDQWYISKAFFEANYEVNPIAEGLILEEALMSVRVEVNEAGIYTTKFTVPGGTTNEFTFGTDEDEAKAKTAMLMSGITQGLEFVQDTVRDQYGEAENESIEE